MPPEIQRFVGFLLLILLLGIAKGNSQSVYNSITRISRANDAIKNAKTLTEAGNHKAAYSAYVFAIDSLGLESEAALVNKGQAAFKSGYETEAKRIFNTLSASENRAYRSTALNQLGILAKDPSEAIGLFKEALKANPNNEAARKNYELAYKKLKKEGKDPQKETKPQAPKPKQDPKNPEEKNKDKGEGNKPKEPENRPQDSNKPNPNSPKQEGKENKPQESPSNKAPQEPQKGSDDKQDNPQSPKSPNEKEANPKDERNKSQQDKRNGLEENKPLADNGDDKSEGKERSNLPKVSVNKQKLAELNLTEEQAKNLLDAMKASEVQYLQQMKRGTKKRASRGNKQDW